jgi:putative redox protein
MSVRESEPELGVNRASGRMLTKTAAAITVRHFEPFVADEPPERGGEDRGQTPLELVLMGLCACTNVSTARMAEKLRFAYDELETDAEAEIDVRGRKGTADVPVHWRKVRLTVRIRTDEDDARLARLADLVARYCPVDSLIRAAVPEYEVTWERRS